ncbi:MAG: ABC transporter substrate-binding protein [Dictyoglomus sp.]|nr:ABC transporter substrate-binding protein [Dictyoglomus sp.]MCX7942656.1 ABC transporter substrate-binding protein [Dictyoglomaceae bacterium]MDW8187912.1 ABC transporter substrate-binding protein [Dictyoglomus sp.]
MMKKLIFIFILVILTTSSSQVLTNLPRNELLIVDALHGRIMNPKDFNFWKPGFLPGNGAHQMLFDALWYHDPQTGKIINALAESPPHYDKNYRKMTVKLRKGIYWSDNKPFTADDVVFTVNYQMKNIGLVYSDYFNHYVSKVYKTDDYTVVFEFNNPSPSFHYIFTALVFSTCYIMPKHKFERIKDPLKYEFYPPVSLGPYILNKYDPSGYWWLFERREDWIRTSVGQIYGMPSPKYVLFIYYGPDEKKIMAQSRHELDLITDLTPEAWEVLRRSNPFSRVWYRDFPWAWMGDVRSRAIGMNLEKYPYNLKDVRWALTLAIDIIDIVVSGFNGILRLSPLFIGATGSLTEEYYLALEDWLKDFELENGFKPWDSNIPFKIEEHIKRKGISFEGQAREIWGIGWWRYSKEEAEKLLLKNGFRRDQKGKWLLPDGKPWKITITAPAGSEIQGTRLAFLVAEQWRRFGIDVNVETLEIVNFLTKLSLGNFDVISYWSIPSVDIYLAIPQYHSKFYKSIGRIATTQNFIRWKNKIVDEIIERLILVPPENPKSKELIMEFIKLFLEENPALIFTITIKFCAQDNYYWTNFPSSDNPYMAPVWWWGQFKFILPFIKPTGRI